MKSAANRVAKFVYFIQQSLQLCLICYLVFCLLFVHICGIETLCSYSDSCTIYGISKEEIDSILKDLHANEKVKDFLAVANGQIEPSRELFVKHFQNCDMKSRSELYQACHKVFCGV